MRNRKITDKQKQGQGEVVKEYEMRTRNSWSCKRMRWCCKRKGRSRRSSRGKRRRSWRRKVP
jgi:hypothetical protein